MIKLYICCLVLIIWSVEVGPDMDMKFHQVVMKIVSYDICICLFEDILYFGCILDTATESVFEISKFFFSQNI